MPGIGSTPRTPCDNLAVTPPCHHPENIHFHDIPSDSYLQCSATILVSGHIQRCPCAAFVPPSPYPPASGAVPPWAITRKPQWRVLVFDTNDKLMDIPESDVVSIECEDIVNGGSGNGTVVFRRDIYNVGEIGWGFTVAVWFWSSNETGGVTFGDPWYVGHVVDLDQTQLHTTGEIKVTLEGEAKRLDDALVWVSINPGADWGNPTLPANALLGFILGTYAEAKYFSAPVIPSGMANLYAARWDGSPLATVLDDICKQVRDIYGQLYTWRCTTKLIGWGTSACYLQRYIVVLPDQNPNVPSNNVPFHALLLRGDLYEYVCSTKYRDLRNVVYAKGSVPITTSDYTPYVQAWLTADGGKAKGTYKVSEVGLHTVVEITLERDGKPLPPEKATIWIRDKDRMVWYPEGEWKGVALNRKK